jgi:hypothetical protein
MTTFRSASRPPVASLSASGRGRPDVAGQADTHGAVIRAATACGGRCATTPYDRRHGGWRAGAPRETPSEG